MIWFGWVLWHINHCRLYNAKSSLYIYIKYIWFGLVGWFLWHINHCRLFNTKSSLYIYIKYIWYGLVEFYGISTIVGYLMLNSFLYIFIKLATIVEGDPKVTFSIASTLRCRGGRHSIHWIAPLDTYLIMLSVKQGSIKYHFLNLFEPDHQIV